MSKLGIYEFVRLELSEKAELLWDKGEFITDIKKGSEKRVLYVLSDFYVEVVYNGQSNKILDIVPFKSQSKLDNYLGEIELPELD